MCACRKDACIACLRAWLSTQGRWFLWNSSLKMLFHDVFFVLPQRYRCEGIYLPILKIEDTSYQGAVKTGAQIKAKIVKSTN